ncbi:MAG: hypothetical protein HYT65_00035 [Candidatus Yanofskybacteria bacterium]|nr:hypothetical protein [Candidatus Yanofskybacteria bacterium]
MTSSQKFPWIIFSFILVAFGAYIFMSFTAAPTAVSKELGLGKDIARFIVVLTFALPLFAAFFWGLWGSKLLFKAEGSDNIKTRGLHLLATGILITVLVLLVNIMLGQIRSRILIPLNIYEIEKISTIVTNYIYSFGYLLSFYIIFRGTQKMTTATAAYKTWNVLTSAIVVILVGTLYVGLSLSNPDRMISLTPGVRPSHYLSDVLILTTVILPSMLAWFFGIVTAFNLADIFSSPDYQSHQKSYQNLFSGMLLIIFSIIILQTILSIGTTRFIVIGLTPVLALIYLFAFALAIGNFFLLRAAKNLSATS